MENSGIESLVDLIERIEINEENREQIKEIKKFMEEENYVEAIKLLKKLKSEEKIKLKEIKEPKEKVFEEEFIPEDEESEENEQIYPKRLLNKKLEEKYIGLLLENPKAISMYYILHEDCYFQSEEMLNIYKSVLFTEGQAYAPQIAKNEFNFAKEGAETYKRKIELREEAQNGKYDFENIEAIDLELFNNHLTALLNGETIECPEFDFSVGTKRYKGKTMHLADDEILVIEGIHCLNDKLTSQIPKENKYKVYISDLTVLNMDRLNRISTTDSRLIRRIVRDYQFRNYSAEHTLDSWPKVNRGERVNIFPYQETADSMFNTSLIYEIAALKNIALPLLQAITPDKREHAEAVRLINILKYFEPIPSEYIPANSLLKEFLGGGYFEY